MLSIERLEPRHMLSAGASDVNGDGEITPIDALEVINAINGDTPALVSHDVNTDGLVTPIDALIVINRLEPLPPPPAPVAPAAHTFTVLVKPGPLGNHLTSDDMVEAVRLGLNKFTEVADVDFRIVFNGPHDVRVETAVINHGKQHFRGQYGGGVIQLHSGYAPPGTHSCRDAPCNVGFVSDAFWGRSGPETPGKIVTHEFGHYLGWGHTHDKNCTMHSNASAPFCASEISRLVSRFGESTVPGGRL